MERDFMCCAWICRVLLPLILLLAAIPCFLECSESPGAVGGKMYPRGNHWAVGHLMGKKSTERLTELREAFGMSGLDQREAAEESSMMMRHKLAQLYSSRRDHRAKHLRLKELSHLILKLLGQNSIL